MNNGNLRTMEWLLGGDCSDIAEDVKRDSLIEGLSFILGKFESLVETEDELALLETLEIDEDVSELEDVLKRIQTKLLSSDLKIINEMDASVIAVAVPAAASLIAGASAALLKTWMKTGSIIPVGLQGATHSLNRWLNSVNGKDKAERRAALAKKFAEKHPEASPIQIKAMIARIESDEVAGVRPKGSTYVPPPDSAKHGTYDNDIGRAFRINNMSDKERAEYNKKRFPNKKKK